MPENAAIFFLPVFGSILFTGLAIYIFPGIYLVECVKRNESAIKLRYSFGYNFFR